MESQVYQILEAVIIKDSLNLYMTRLAEQHRAHPDFEATMRFVASLYKRYAKIAATKCQTDEAGRITVRRDIRRDFDQN